MTVVDIAAIVAITKKHDVLVVVDNTFATPVNLNPLAFGVDLVIHSITKYLGGHSDITGGAVVGSKELLNPIWDWRKNFGQMMVPEVTHLLARSLRTLVVRVNAHSTSAQILAERLVEHLRIIKIFVCFIISIAE